MTDLALTIDEASPLIDAEKLSPGRAHRGLHRQDGSARPTLLTYVTFTPEAALDTAKHAPRAEIMAGKRSRGPLHGIPVGSQGHLRHRRD